MGSASPKKKNLLITYVLWLFLGVFGAHHFYLGREDQAVVWLCTLGGFGFGWIRDFFCIRRYVAEANDDPEILQKYVKQMRCYAKPPFSVARFLGAVGVGYFFSMATHFPTPEDASTSGFDWSLLNCISPLACSLGVWLVGNIGKEQGHIWWCLAGSYLSYIFSLNEAEDSSWFTMMPIISAMMFESLSKDWRRKPKEKKPLRKIAIYAAFALLFSCNIYARKSLIIDEETEQAFELREFWEELKLMMSDNRTWWEKWEEVKEVWSPISKKETDAYEILGLGWGATEAEITTKWKALSKEHHPDKVKEPEKKLEAQNKFMDIQQAYELLSSRKARRQRRNKKSLNT